MEILRKSPKTIFIAGSDKSAVCILDSNIVKIKILNSRIVKKTMSGWGIYLEKRHLSFSYSYLLGTMQLLVHVVFENALCLTSFNLCDFTLHGFVRTRIFQTFATDFAETCISIPKIANSQMKYD